jgi:peptidoglycan/xylan/chitin deacetylase (PgdA/CDA1 family)
VAERTKTDDSSPDERVINLTFHGVGEAARSLSKPEAALWVSEKAFEAIVARARERPAIRLTFDDANESDVTRALPVLVRHGLRGTFFVPAAQLGRSGFLSEPGVRALVDAGMTIGSHGMHHRPWRGLALDELDIELSAARDRLEDVSGLPIRQAACPFGAYDRRVLKRLRAFGYERVFTSDGGPARTNDWLQPRNSVRATDGTDLIDRLLMQPSLISRVVRGSKSVVKKVR